MKIKIPFISAIFQAFQQSWNARTIIVNPILTFLLFLKSSLLGKDFIYRFKYKSYQLLSRWVDWVAVEEVILRGEYNEILDAIKCLERPVILDLGANIGMFSIQAFQYNRGAIIHAVEPSSATFQVIEKNQQVNPGLRWHIYQYALWSQDGSIDFEENPQASTGSHLGKSDQAVQVPAIRLSTLVEKNVGGPINLIKMDIEGAEEIVLFDSINVLENTGILILEIHPYRCDEAKIRHLLYSIFPNIYEITGRLSSKPLLVCSRKSIEFKNALKVQ